MNASWKHAARNVAIGTLQVVALCVAVLTLAPAVGAHGGAVPVAAIGLALMFALLAVRAIKPVWPEPGAPFLARHLGLLFVPILVNIGFAWPLPAHLIVPVFASLALSATAGLIVTGLVFEAGCRQRRSACRLGERLKACPNRPLLGRYAISTPRVSRRAFAKP